MQHVRVDNLISAFENSSRRQQTIANDGDVYTAGFASNVNVDYDDNGDAVD